VLVGLWATRLNSLQSLMRHSNSSAIKETIGLYVVVIGLLGSGILFSLYAGRNLTKPTAEPARTTAVQVSRVAPPPTLQSSAGSGLALNASSALSHLFIQLGLIIGASWAVGWAFVRLGQPAVIGEMMTGVLLGPSLFGLLAPKAFSFIFAPGSLDTLRLFSQIGVCLFMFAVGMELNLAQLRHSAHRYLVIGHSSILIPYLCGVLLSFLLYSEYAGEGVSFTAFALLIGISMSITAFPVLVRILKDQHLFGSTLGQIATLCAAIGDVSAWCILAFVIAIARNHDIQAVAFTLTLVVFYATAMFLIVKPLLRQWLGRFLFEEYEPTKGVLALVLGAVIVSSLSTEIIGIHSLFGAFLAGIIMPAGGGFRKKLALRVEHFSSVLLLPLFFAFTGLRTEIGLLKGAHDWLICLGITAVATVGKLGGTAVVSRLMKIPWHDSWELGVLMNTRGLMELIVLNIGYDLGILSLRIFSMLVLMAIATTMMTGPLITLLRKNPPHV
jgi:Kef-type K+ transport system membrane component KefB